MRRQRGLTLLEVMVALVVLAVGVTALQRLVVRSVGTITADARTGRALLAAQTLLAAAAAAPPAIGHSEGTTADGLRFARDVARTPRPALREIRVRVWPGPDSSPMELVELVVVPPA
jgi:prepilin-type N-terminal cleavage/methylation domain-containing protein